MKSIKIIVAGYVVLFVLGFLVINIFEVKVEELASLNTIDALTWYRNIFYLITIVSWPYLSRLLAKKREYAKLSANAFVFANDTEEQRYFTKIKQQTAFENKYFKSAWWKVALFFVIFEIMAVQKLWL